MIAAPAPIPLRPPDAVMRLDRLGAAHPTRLSFLRVLLRRIAAEGWRCNRPLWQIDGRGVGLACYRVQGPARAYTLVAFSHDLPDDQRTDRVIATAWDATFALFDGIPTEADLDRLSRNVPLQEAGRITGSELTLARANRSVRLFDHVVARLAGGQQPDPDELDAVGYLMRTTAVYGAGKFGAADRADLAGREELAVPFQAEMLTVWLIRAFTVDLAEHLAVARGGAGAVRLDPALRRGLGVGNSTGLGMAPFVVRHPVLFNNWIIARECALAMVRNLQGAAPGAVAALHGALAEARQNAGIWRSDHPIQTARLADLRADLARIGDRLETWPGKGARPWDALWRWGARLTLEGQEALLSLLLEPHGALVDGLSGCMAADEDTPFAVDGAMTLGTLRTLISDRYPWVQALDFSDPAAEARFWYVSQEKLEPRLGERASDEGAALEQPLDTARAVAALARTTEGWPDSATVARLLQDAPDHRHTVRRVQISARHPYAEIRDNLIGADMRPIDILRCKLAFFGATRFDPRSDRWVRISLFQGAPFPDEIGG